MSAPAARGSASPPVLAEGLWLWLRPYVFATRGGVWLRLYRLLK